MRRRVGSPPQLRDRWLVSYADLLTLLLAFFVVLFAAAEKSIADPDEQSSSALRQALRSFTGEGTPDTPPDTRLGTRTRGIVTSAPTTTAAADMAARADLDRRIRQLLATEMAQGSVSVTERADALVLSLSEAGFYRSGSAELRPRSGVVLDRIAEELRRARCDIRIEGHTDATPIQTALYRSNWELSTARATGLVRRYIEQGGIAPQRLSAAGYAQFHPIAPETNVEGRARNRRVDIVLYGLH